jgi:inosine-uridine nucleoside N-ribohydrolase
MTDADSSQKIFLDCDPGIDDAFAIVFACGHPGLDLCGVSTAAGNVGLARTTANALSVLEFAGHPQVPVAAGSPRPLLRPPIEARNVHGESGLGAARLPPAGGRVRDAHAIDLLIDTVSASPGEITLVATGPLTNIALAVRRYPALVSQVAGFVIMGGSAGTGNVTPAAEFNIACDPEAAAIVFGAGWRVTMVGLDVTRQARADRAVQERMRGLGRLGSELLLPGLSGYYGGDPTRVDPGPPVHDVCALALVAEPGLFGCQPARVEVETAGRLTSGMTVTDFRADDEACNTLVATSVDVPGFWDLVLSAYARVPAARDAAR